jgi:hypothetical protein
MTRSSGAANTDCCARLRLDTLPVSNHLLILRSVTEQSVQAGLGRVPSFPPAQSAAAGGTLTYPFTAPVMALTYCSTKNE